MGERFNSLSNQERAAIATHVGNDYDKLLFQQPSTYITKNAAADPKAWQDAVCELIATDPGRVRQIIDKARQAASKPSGFTLIELSIVLVTIGLIVGSVLVGRDLIRAAEVRATISQIEKYNTAVNTFRGKFGYLPGDILASQVTQFGFTASPVRAGTAGLGDGNGELDGLGGGLVYAWAESGENLFFWEDLSANSGLIEGNFNSAADGVNTVCSTPAACSVYLPPAKLGGGNSIYVYSGYAQGCCAAYTGIGPNFFGLSVINSIGGGSNVGAGGTPPAPGLTVAQAHDIDMKVDDGKPTTGNVLAQYLGNSGSLGVPSWSPNATPDTSSTCYDPAANQYSVTQNSGNGVNCALSFQFQ